ncbi:TPA: hypothetical protein DD690_00830 [Candidatus Daviesbacteria bacterium]|nr:MAG: hypothetical protein A3D02_02500 [Candidatus Daviesbacteria bacterium RIFCSPHIGHO2_02_FULL_39_41]OGE45190.1 MAG: hypothetical protein A3E67_03225 [Candidatus Daviesbacteria bacterium RIFCSPHIGHO2_12_FULL_38_25]OGE72179.1 MAG: hypothetical protein A3H18_01655 [Candidatus Daviesbacteria bacterium RIFCSPLOWO2_12_FULL_38_10]HBQ50509.1 hypothetical protein [Candidatus Daviesbacteria bacterium]HCB22449.1 hypothetical protein [Candidatus Daviesbacteria bacterium]
MRERERESKKGFTLVELLVVIAIIAVLSAVGLVMFSSTQKSGRITKRIQDLKAIQTALELYYNQNGKYPSQPMTWACIINLSGVNNLAPNFMVVVPSDPLGDTQYCYQYLSSNNDFEYKVRTNANVFVNSEMSSDQFKQQKNLIDPAKDGTEDCLVQTTGIVRGWAVYSGSNICQAP